MKDNLIRDINNYISYLNSKGFSVSVHGKNIAGFIENNIHNNPYCNIKSNLVKFKSIKEW